MTPPLTRSRTGARGQDGFTLVELVITISITGIIMGAVATALIAGFRITDETNARIAHSHDRHIVAAYFANDVQGAAAPTDGGVVLGTTVCSAGSPGTPIVSFRSKDTGAEPTEETISVTYAFVNGVLKRRYCKGASSPTDTDIATSLAGPPTASCPSSESCVLNLTDENGTYNLRGNRRPA